MYKYSLGKNIQALRLQKGLSQEKLAEMIDMSAHHLSSIERGAHLMRIDKLIALMNALDCSPNQIFKDDVRAASCTDTALLSARLEALPLSEQERILTILDVLIKTSPYSNG